MALLRMGREVLDPFAEMEKLQNEINSLFEYDRGSSVHGLFDRAVSPAVDVIETADDYFVYCDLPGVKLSDLDISIAGGVLTMKGEKRSPDDVKGARIYKQETWDGHFQRTLSIPDSIDVNNIEAVLDAGVLRVKLPKKEEVKPRQIQIRAN